MPAGLVIKATWKRHALCMIMFVMISSDMLLQAFKASPPHMVIGPDSAQRGRATTGSYSLGTMST